MAKLPKHWIKESQLELMYDYNYKYDQNITYTQYKDGFVETMTKAGFDIYIVNDDMKVIEKHVRNEKDNSSRKS